MAILGCIADDFTGASDAASFLVKGGLSVYLYNGIPDETCTPSCSMDDAQAIVIALKSRTQEKKHAVNDTVTAANFLLRKGIHQLYFKYCSTFDSTPEGNIGPVADALIDLLKVDYTLLCPALPVNGRTVVDGCLMVNGIPLSESHMKNHPLTPMWDSRIDKLMEPQSRYPCYILRSDELNVFNAETTFNKPYYIIPDYTTMDDGEAIVEKFGMNPLLTGGSGLLEPLARMWSKKLNCDIQVPSSTAAGKALLVAGSCSNVTLQQIEYYKSQGKPSYKLNPKDILEKKQTIKDVWLFVSQHEDESVLVYSSDTPDKVKEYQKLGKEKVASALESLTAQLVSLAVKNGYTRIISAGGETSGAVTKELGFSSYWIGESVSPGVPIMTPIENTNIRLILKSGNFGQEDFFIKALDMTQEQTKGK